MRASDRSGWSEGVALTVAKLVATAAIALLGLAVSRADIPNPTVAPPHRALSFQPNFGQTSADIQYSALEPGYAVHLADRGIYFVYGAPAHDSALQKLAWEFLHKRLHLPRGRGAQAHTVAIEFADAAAHPAARSAVHPAVHWSGAEPVAGVSHFLRGNDPAAWRRDVPHFARARAASVYPGIDLAFYDHAGRLEYDFLVAPGADPAQIRLRARGAGAPRIAPDGAAEWPVDSAPLRLHAPLAYQVIDGARRPVEARYVVERGAVGLKLGDYDSSAPLVVDPILDFAAIVGGNDNTTVPLGMAVDAAGNTYVAGTTCSSAYPSTPGSADPHGGASLLADYCEDVFVTKLAPDGASLVYSTFIGGSKRDFGARLALNAAGEVYLTGTTTSTDFPVTSGAFQTSAGAGSCQSSSHLTVPCSDAFVVHLSADGSKLLYATYVGGSSMDGGTGIAIDASGAAYVAGFSNSANFPVTANAAQKTFGGGSCYAGTMPCFDAVAFKLSADGSQLLYATFLGGSDTDIATSIAVDASGAAYVGGSSFSTNFPTTSGVLRATHTATAGQEDAFVTKLSADGSQRLYSTLLGGSNSDWLLDLKIDSAGNAYVTGGTGSSDFPTTPGAFQTSYAGPANAVCTPSFAYAPCGDVFVAKLNPAATALVFSTLIGGSGNDSAASLSLDASQNVWLAGATMSSDFPLSADHFYGSNANAGFLAELSADGTKLLYGSGLLPSGAGGLGTGVATPASGAIYVSGQALVAANVATPGAYQSGSSGAFVMRFSAGTGPQVQLSATSLSVPPASDAEAVGGTSAPQTITLTNSGSGSLIATVSIVGGNFYQTNNCPAALTAGASCTISVYFAPTATGPQAATLVIESNAPGPNTVLLTGRANDPQGGGFVPATLDFGAQQAGTTSAVTQNSSLVLQASDSFPHVRAVAVGGTNPGDFTINLSNCPVGTAYCGVSAQFSPGASATGTRSATVSASSDAYGSPQVLTLTGTVASGPVLAVRPTTLDFGTTAVAASSSIQTLFLYNTGSAALSVTGLSLDADFAVASGGSAGSCGGFPITLAPQASCTLNLELTPSKAGNLNATVSFASNSSVNTPGITLLGAGGPASGPILNVVSGGYSFDFGVNEVGTVLNVPAFFSLFNAGAQAATLSVSYPTDYQVATQYSSCGTSLAANSACTLAVTFAPSAAGTRSGTLTLTSNAPSSPIAINLTGTGILVPLARLSPASLDFGYVGVGGTSATQSITLTNPGNGSLTIASATASSPFAIVSNGCPATLAAGATCTLSVRGQPSAPGDVTGTLQFGTNAVGHTHTVPLHLQAVAGPAINLLPVALDFGRQAAHTTSAAQGLALLNTGNTGVTIAGVVTNGDYQQTNNCPASLAAGASCTINVTFTPSSTTDPISLVGNVAVSGNMAGSPVLVPLSGIGAAATGATTSTTLSVAPNAATAGQTVTLTAAVSSATAGTITGTVTFLDGVNVLGTAAINSGSATLSTTQLAAGAHTLSAQYGGSASFQGSSSAPVSLQVGAAAADFSLSASPATATVKAGQSAAVAVAVAPLNGSTQAVTLSCSGLPAYSTCSFSPAATTTLNGTASSTVTVNLNTNVATALLLEARSLRYASLGGLGPLGGGLGAGAALSAFLLLGLLPSRRLRYAALMIAAGLLVAACSSSGSGSGGAAGGGGGGNVTPTGTYTVTITGTAGASSHTTSVALTVQ